MCEKSEAAQLRSMKRYRSCVSRKSEPQRQNKVQTAQDTFISNEQVTADLTDRLTEAVTDCEQMEAATRR